MIFKYRKILQLSLAVVVGAGALALIIPEQASAGEAPGFVCYRGRTIGPLSAAAVEAYISAGAKRGPCVITPP